MYKNVNVTTIMFLMSGNLTGLCLFMLIHYCVAFIGMLASINLYYLHCNFSHYKIEIVLSCSDSSTLELSLFALKDAVSSESCL